MTILPSYVLKNTHKAMNIFHSYFTLLSIKCWNTKPFLSTCYVVRKYSYYSSEFLCCQVDFNLPERFNMVYVDAETSRKQPIMIHRAILGSIERFFGILVENYAGDFPLWLAPVQCRLLPVTDHEVTFCSSLTLMLEKFSTLIMVNNLGRCIV